MTIEISLEDLTQITEATEKFGACVFKTKSTTGEAVWLYVQDQKRRGRRTKVNGPQELPHSGETAGDAGKAGA